MQEEKRENIFTPGKSVKAGQFVASVPVGSGRRCSCRKGESALVAEESLPGGGGEAVAGLERCG